MEQASDFGTALGEVKSGGKMARKGWNGYDMFIFLSEGGITRVYSPDASSDLKRVQDIKLQPHIIMKTADDNYVPWFASQTDMLAEDWLVV